MVALPQTRLSPSAPCADREAEGRSDSGQPSSFFDIFHSELGGLPGEEPATMSIPYAIDTGWLCQSALQP